MIINYEAIKFNLELLEVVKKEFPILEDFENEKVLRTTLDGVGLDQWSEFISYIKNTKLSGQKIIYEEKLKYRDLKVMIANLTTSEKVKNIFLKKTQADFIKIFNDFKVNRRYTRVRNQSYCSALERAEPIILNYFIQNNIEFQETYFKSSAFFRKFSLPKLYSREMKMTQSFLDNFLLFTQQKDLDLRKCNIKSLINELQNRLRPLMKVESGLYVKCIQPRKGFTVDNTYLVHDSRVNYSGFLEIKIENDQKELSYVPYTNFEEISRYRNDVFSELGI